MSIKDDDNDDPKSLLCLGLENADQKSPLAGERKMYQCWTPEEFYNTRHEFSSNTMSLFLKLSSPRIRKIWNHSISSSYEEDMDFEVLMRKKNCTREREKK